MKVAFIGDIVGRPGRKIIKEKLKDLRTQYDIDLVIANGENASHGFGLTIKNAQELIKLRYRRDNRGEPLLGQKTRYVNASGNKTCSKTR